MVQPTALELGVEGAEFTGMQYLFHGGPKNAHQIWEDWTINAGVIGALRAPRAIGAIKNGIKDVKAARDNSKGFDSAPEQKQLLESKKNVLDEIKTDKNKAREKDKDATVEALTEDIATTNKSVLENNVELKELNLMLNIADQLLKSDKKAEAAALPPADIPPPPIKPAKRLSAASFEKAYSPSFSTASP